LDGIFVGKVRRAAHGSLLHTPRLLLVLNFWREKGGQEEAQAWVVETAKDDRKLAEFLERNLQSSSRFGFGDAVGRKRDRLDPNWLQNHLDVNEIAARILKLGEKVELSDRQQRAVSQFLKECSLRKRGGKPPWSVCARRDSLNRKPSR
jgi:predicted KAP-like P-loop ATPase